MIKISVKNKHYPEYITRVTGLRLRYLRELINVSREVFAGELDVVPTTLKNLEMGYRGLNFGFIKTTFDRLMYSTMVVTGANVHSEQIWFWLTGAGELEDIKRYEHLFIRGHRANIGRYHDLTREQYDDILAKLLEKLESGK